MVVSPRFYQHYVNLPPNDIVPPEIHSNPKLYPFFEHCRGAIDEMHIDTFVPNDALTAHYHNRKGCLSQNVLTACTFDMHFSYVLAGWEGSAADSCIYNDAQQTDFPIPPNLCYLADAGFPLCDSLLVPYHGVCYHLKEWGRSSQRYDFFLLINHLKNAEK